MLMGLDLMLVLSTERLCSLNLVSVFETSLSFAYVLLMAAGTVSCELCFWCYR